MLSIDCRAREKGAGPARWSDGMWLWRCSSDVVDSWQVQIRHLRYDHFLIPPSIFMEDHVIIDAYGSGYTSSVCRYHHSIFQKRKKKKSKLIGSRQIFRMPIWLRIDDAGGGEFQYVIGNPCDQRKSRWDLIFNGNIQSDNAAQITLNEYYVLQYKYVGQNKSNVQTWDW